LQRPGLVPKTGGPPASQIGSIPLKDKAQCPTITVQSCIYNPSRHRLKLVFGFPIRARALAENAPEKLNGI
jgi:hypothetical protein